MPESPGGNLATAPNNKNTVQSDGAAAWPETGSGPVAFLIDARDDFEAGLLRDWVESGKPDSDPKYSFIETSAATAKDRRPENHPTLGFRQIVLHPYRKSAATVPSLHHTLLLYIFS